MPLKKAPRITEVDGKILYADESVKSLKETLEELRHEELLKKQEKELDFEQKLFETKMKFQTELQTAKKQAEEENKFTASGSESGHGSPAKLPKLNTSRFDGTYEDWPRFWNQFVEIIDKTTMAGVTKFACLKSFLDPKVKKSIEGLPFSNEGYNRAKPILLDKHGKDSEIIKAYTRQIFDLPIIVWFQKISIPPPRMVLPIIPPHPLRISVPEGSCITPPPPMNFLFSFSWPYIAAFRDFRPLTA